MSGLWRAISSMMFLGLLFVAPCFGGSVENSVPAPEEIDFLAKFHGHVCGGSLFGARLGRAAKEALLKSGAKGKLKAQYFDLSCPVDGIQVFAGTTYGNAAITVFDRDEHRLRLIAVDSKHYVEASLTSKALALAKKSKELRNHANKQEENSVKRLAIEQEIAAIFLWLRTAPTPEVVTLVYGQED